MPVLLHKDLSSELIHAPRLDGTTLTLEDGGAGEAQQAQLNTANVTNNRPLYFDGTTLRTSTLTASRVLYSDSNGGLRASTTAHGELDILRNATSMGVSKEDLYTIANFEGKVAADANDVFILSGHTLNIAGSLAFSGTVIQATAAELNYSLHDCTASSSELNRCSTSPGEVNPFQVMVTDASNNLDDGSSGNNINDMRIAGTLTVDNVIANSINAPVQGVADTSLAWVAPITLNFTGDTVGTVEFAGGEGSINVPLTANHSHTEHLRADGGVMATGPITMTEDTALRGEVVEGSPIDLAQVKLSYGGIACLLYGHPGIAPPVVITSQTAPFWVDPDAPATRYPIWTAGNQGSGTGMDADLLDGEHSAYYRNASNMSSGVLSSDRGGLGNTSWVDGDVPVYSNSFTRFNALPGGVAAIVRTNIDSTVLTGINHTYSFNSSASSSLYFRENSSSDYLRIYSDADYFAVGDDAFILELGDPDTTGANSNCGIVFRARSESGSVECREMLTIRSEGGENVIRVGRNDVVNEGQRPADGFKLLHEGNLTEYALPTVYDSPENEYQAQGVLSMRTNQLRFGDDNARSHLSVLGSDLHIWNDHYTAGGAAIHFFCRAINGDGTPDTLMPVLTINTENYGETLLRFQGAEKFRTQEEGIKVTGTISREVAEFSYDTPVTNMNTIAAETISYFDLDNNLLGEFGLTKGTATYDHFVAPMDGVYKFDLDVQVEITAGVAAVGDFIGCYLGEFNPSTNATISYEVNRQAVSSGSGEVYHSVSMSGMMLYLTEGTAMRIGVRNSLASGITASATARFSVQLVNR